MRRLGELLLDRGAIDINELHTGLEACQRSGGRLGTQLLRYGFVTEKDLLEALSMQYSVPFIPEMVLLKASMEVRKLIPLEVLQKYQAMPFDKVHGRLMVAMANPRDPAALDEMAALTDLDIEACVATETAIYKALDEMESVVVQYVDDSGEYPAVVPPMAAAEWEELWGTSNVGPDELFSVGSLPPVDARKWVATFPGLTPVSEDGISEIHAVLDEESFRHELQTISHRDQVADIFLRFVAAYLPRLALFAVHRGKIVGWHARGQSMVVEDVQTLSIAVDADSVLRHPCATGDPYLGAVPPTEANDILIQCLGDPVPIEVVVIPVMVKERVVAVLLGDTPGESAEAVRVAELVEAAKLVDVAFEILILRNKLQV